LARALWAISFEPARAVETSGCPHAAIREDISDCDCIDEKRSEWFTMPDTGKRYAVKKPFFVPQHFERSTLFKIPTRELDIYCWENNQDPEEKFKACYDANKPTGLKFELAWTDEPSPARRRSKPLSGRRTGR
jgi:hypothetical protein